jgi:hypothetical protein
VDVLPVVCKQGVRGSSPLSSTLSCLETSFTGVSGHSSYPRGLGLVVAGGVEGEFADELSGVLCDDPQFQVAGEDEDFGAGPAAADADVVEPAVVAQVSLPSASTRSRRTRKCSLMRMPWRAGMALGRAFQASAGVRRPMAWCDRRVL